MLIRLSPLRDLSRFMSSDGDSVSVKAMLHSGPHSFACSGVILSSRSKFIKKCLTGGSDIIIPQEIQPEQVTQCLRLLYGGSLELDTTNIASLLKMSIHLELDELFERCAEWLEGNWMENSAAQLISSTTSKSKLEVANMLDKVYSKPDGPIIESNSYLSDRSINPKNSFLLKESTYERNWQHDTSNDHHLNEKPALGLEETDLRFKLESTGINSNLNKTKADSGKWRHDNFEDYLNDTGPDLCHTAKSYTRNYAEPKVEKKWNLDVFKNQPSLHRLSTDVTEHETSDSLSFRSPMKIDHDLSVNLYNRRVDANLKKSTTIHDKWQHDKFTGDHVDSNASPIWSHDAKSKSGNAESNDEKKRNLDVFTNQASFHSLSTCTDVTEHKTSDSLSFRSRLRSDHEVNARKVDMKSIEHWQHDKRDTDDSIVEGLDNLKIPIEPTVPFKPNDLSCWESFSSTDILKLCSKSCHLPEFAKMEVVLGWIMKLKIPNRQEALDKFLCNIDPLKLSDRYISILNEWLSNTSNLLLPSNFDSHVTSTYRDESVKSQCELIAHQWSVKPANGRTYFANLKSGYVTVVTSCHLCSSPHQALTLKLVNDTPCYEKKDVPPLAVLGKHFHPGSICHWLIKTDVVGKSYKLMSLITTPYKDVVKAIHQPNASLAIICLQRRSVQ